MQRPWSRPAGATATSHPVRAAGTATVLRGGRATVAGTARRLRRGAHRAGAWTTAALLTACASEGRGGQAEGGARAGGEDAASASAPAAELPAAVRFALEVPAGGEGPVWIQLNDAEDQPAWIHVSGGGERVYLRPRCEIEDCANLGEVCGAAMPMVEDVTGRSVELVWDGRTSVVAGASGCETREPAAAGSYVARFCYAAEATFDLPGAPEGVEGAVPGRVVDPTCVERTFALTDAEVVVTVVR